MKVAFLGIEGSFNKDSGRGPYIHNFQLYEHLKRMRANISIDKITIKVPNFLGGGTSFTGNYLSFAISNLFRDFRKYDIIHNLFYYSPIILKSKAPLLTTVHDGREIIFDKRYKTDVIFDKRYKTDVNGLIYKRMVKFVGTQNLNSDYLLVPSMQTKEELTNLGFSSSKIFITPHGIDRAFISTRIRYKNQTKNLIVGYLGSFNPNKNVQFLIKAANKIDNNYIKFDIWGAGPEFEHLRKESKNKNILFRGFAPEDKKVEIYDSFDVFVFPSLYEGFGIPIIEAQARGLPVIIYKYGKIPKEVRRYCFEAESPEHMAQIIEQLKENGYKEKDRKKAMEYARSFTWEKTARETLKVYENALK